MTAGSSAGKTDGGQKTTQKHFLNAERNYQLRSLNPAKVSLKSEAEIKRFSDKQRLKEFVNTL